MIHKNNTNFQEFTTCLTASALLRGGWGLGSKSGWTVESQAWHCCRVSCRLTCFWSSCSKLWYTWDNTTMLRLWELLSTSIKIIEIQWNMTSTSKWIFPPRLRNFIHISKVVVCLPKCCKMQWPPPVDNFWVHTSQCNIWIRGREHAQGKHNCRGMLEYIKSLKLIVINISQRFLQLLFLWYKYCTFCLS